MLLFPLHFTIILILPFTYCSYQVVMDPIESPFTEGQLAVFTANAMPVGLDEGPETFLGGLVQTIRIMDWVLAHHD